MSADWLRFDRDVVLRAGAGAGKTHALVTLYLHLVAGATARRRPVPPAAIIAISFTEKAAADLNARIRARLSRLATVGAAAEPELCASAAALGVELPDVDGWERHLQQLGGAPVGTFHRLCGALLRRHAVAARIDPAYQQLDEAEASERLQAAAERAVLAALDRGDAGAQALAVELGFASGGFTPGLVETLARLHQRRAEEGRGAAGLDDNYRPEALAAGWRAAAATLLREARALAALPGLGAKWVELQRGLRAAVDASGSLEAALAAVTPEGDPEPALAAARALVAPIAGSSARGPGCKEAKQALVAALAALEEQAHSRRAAPLAAELALLLDDTGGRYAEAKRRLGALDFADLIVRARDLLRDHPDVLAAERARCEVLLVDEFQDTNAAQAELVRLLAGEPEERGDPEGAVARLLVVGDRKQSIYEFRGADVAVFVGFEEAVRAGGGARGVLGRSYRSRPPLVRLANALFARAFAAPPDAPRFRIVWDPATDPLDPARPDAPDGEPKDDGDGDGDGAHDRESQGARDTKSRGEPAAELLALDAAAVPADAESRRLAEARALAARLAALHTSGQRDMALLLRGYTHLDVYLEALRHAGVPHYVVNGRGFFEAQEVRDLAAALRLFDDPDDRLVLCTVLRSPLVLLSDETLLRLQLAGLLRLGPILDGRAAAAMPAPANDEEAEEHRRLDRFAALATDLRRRADRLGPAGLLRALADDTELEAALAGGYHGEQRIANFLALLERARAVEEAGGDLRSFVRRLAELTEPGAGDREAQAQIAAERDDVVRVMTVHQSKGLEFAVVAVAACGAGEQRDRGPVLYDGDAGLGLKLRQGADWSDTGPSRKVAAMRLAKAHAESLRLFYVAVTRARDHLILSGEAGRGGAGTWRGLVDDALGEDPEIARLLAVVPAGSLVAPPAVAPPSLPAGEPREAAVLLARAAAAPPPAPPAPLTVAVTQLADFALCPRRHNLLHVVGLAEHPRAARPASPDAADPELDPLARGTLAHRLLELADPTRGGGDLDELLRSGGYDPEAPEVSGVRAHVARFLATPFARALAGPGAAALEVRRELPFLLVEPGDHGAPIRLRGQIDLLVIDHASRTATVVDYKHSRAGTGDDYRFQLDAYALAARRLVPGAACVRTGLAFLREADPSPALAEHDATSSDAFAASLAHLGGELARARATGRYDGRKVETCRAIGCGYLGRCHPERG